MHDEVGDGTKSGWFRAIDQNFGRDRFDNIECNITRVFRTGSVKHAFATPIRNTQENGNHVQHVAFGMDLSSNDTSHYFFGCSIPPTQEGRISFITSYSVEED